MRLLNWSVLVAVLVSGVAFAFTACKASRGAIRGQMPNPPAPAVTPATDRRVEQFDGEHVVRGVFSYTELSDAEEFYRLFANPLAGELLGRDTERYYFNFTSTDTVCAVPCAKVDPDKLAAVLQARNELFLRNPSYPQLAVVSHSPEFKKWFLGVKWVQ